MTDTVLEMDVGTDEGIEFQKQYQVILYNDDVNPQVYVVQCLMKVFHHPVELSQKIMHEAHSKGRAIAEVEDREPATLHKQQLESYGLTASVEEL